MIVDNSANFHTFIPTRAIAHRKLALRDIYGQSIYSVQYNFLFHGPVYRHYHDRDYILQRDYNVVPHPSGPPLANFQVFKEFYNQTLLFSQKLSSIGGYSCVFCGICQSYTEIKAIFHVLLQRFVRPFLSHLIHARHYQGALLHFCSCWKY